MSSTATDTCLNLGALAWSSPTSMADVTSSYTTSTVFPTFLSPGPPPVDHWSLSTAPLPDFTLYPSQTITGNAPNASDPAAPTETWTHTHVYHHMKNTENAEYQDGSLDQCKRMHELTVATATTNLSSSFTYRVYDTA